MRPVFRIEPKLPVSAMQTYRISTPLATHFRKARTCAEARCRGYTDGWVTRIDETSDLGQAQSRYIRRRSRRVFTEYRQPDGLTAFIFEPGQDCFELADHWVRIERPELFTRHRGDVGRGLSDRVTFRRPDDWVDEFANHQDRIATIRQRG